MSPSEAASIYSAMASAQRWMNGQLWELRRSGGVVRAESVYARLTEAQDILWRRFVLRQA